MKKKIFIGIVLFLSFSISYSQNKKIDNIAKLYNEGNFEDCIEKAEKYIEGDANTPQPYFYLAESKFQIYKSTTDNSIDTKLKSAVRQTYKAVSKDDDKIVRLEFASFMKEIKDTMISVGYRSYNSENTEDAKFYYEYLAKIYNDTTDEYKDLFLPKVFVIEQNLAFGTYTGPKNQTDMAGNRQGLWVEYYENGLVKHEINFVNNKPVGIYRKYYENGNIKANMNFDESSTKASAVLYYENGNKAAMGFYVDQKKDSLWQYFIADTIVLREENFENGLKNGTDKIYYVNGRLLEVKTYSNEVLNGEWRRYYANGQEMFETKYINDVQEGPYVKYYSDGTLFISGKYKNNLKDGKWTYINKDNNETIVIEYVNGEATNQEELEKMESEWLNTTEENQDLLLDPEKYISDPDSFLKDGGY